MFTGTATPTGANVIVAMAVIQNGGPAFIFQDSDSNVYTGPFSVGPDSQGRYFAFAVALNPTVSAGMSVEVFSTTVATVIHIVAAAFTITGNATVAATSGAVSVGNNNVPATSVIGQIANTAVILGWFAGHGVYQSAPGFLSLGQITSANGTTMFAEYQIVGTSGPFAPSASLTPAGPWSGLGIALPDLSTAALLAAPAAQGQTPGAFIAGIPPNMSILAAVSAGLLPANALGINYGATSRGGRTILEAIANGDGNSAGAGFVANGGSPQSTVAAGSTAIIPDNANAAAVTIPAQPVYQG